MAKIIKKPNKSSHKVTTINNRSSYNDSVKATKIPEYLKKKRG